MSTFSDDLVQSLTEAVAHAKGQAILRRFTRGQSHPVFAALLELGKAAKTIFLCKYLDDKSLRREINSGLERVAPNRFHILRP